MTTMLLTLILAVLAGYIMGRVVSHLRLTHRSDGYFIVNFANPEDDMFSMKIDTPLEEIPKARYLIFWIKKIQ